MKRIITLLLVAVMSLSLVACGGKEVETSADVTQQTAEESNGEEKVIENITAETKSQVLIESHRGLLGINNDNFSEILERNELTAENWKEYIKVYSYDTEDGSRYYLGVGNERYYQFQDAVLELKNIESGEVVAFDLDFFRGCEVSEDFMLENYECAKIEGRLYFVNIPEEALHSPLPEYDYELGFILVGSGFEQVFEVNKATKQIERNGNGSWDKYFE